MRQGLPLLFLALAACGSSQGAGPSGAAGTPADRLAAIIESKGCQLGPVRAAEARDEMGLDQAAFDALVARLVQSGRASVHSDGQIELMSEVCI